MFNLYSIQVKRFKHGWSIRANEMRCKEITIKNVCRQNGCEQKAIDAIALGKVDLSTMVTHRFSIEETGRTYRIVAGYDDGVMKSVIRF